MPSKPASAAACAWVSACDGANISCEAENQYFMPRGLPAGVQDRAQAGAVTSAPRPAPELGDLGRIVPAQRARAEVGADDLAPPAREEVDRRRVVGVPAGVGELDLGMQHGGHALGSGTQAEVHVLVEEEGSRVERAEPAQQLRRRG